MDNFAYRLMVTEFILLYGIIVISGTFILNKQTSKNTRPYYFNWPQTTKEEIKPKTKAPKRGKEKLKCSNPDVNVD